MIDLHIQRNALPPGSRMDARQWALGPIHRQANARCSRCVGASRPHCRAFTAQRTSRARHITKAVQRRIAIAP